MKWQYIISLYIDMHTARPCTTYMDCSDDRPSKMPVGRDANWLFQRILRSEKVGDKATWQSHGEVHTQAARANDSEKKKQKKNCVHVCYDVKSWAKWKSYVTVDGQAYNSAKEQAKMRKTTRISSLLL